MQPIDKDTDQDTVKENVMLEWFIPPVLIAGAALIPNKTLGNWEYNKKHVYHHSWMVPIGKKRKVMYHHFEHYPHLLVGGTTRFGKTVFLKSLFTTLLLSNPDRVRFIILDLKGGLEFWKYRNLPQVQVIACDLVEAAKSLDHVYQLMKLDEERFKKNGWNNICDTPLKERTFIIVDEGADLGPKLVTKEQKPLAFLCQTYLSEIARKGGGLGYRLIFATQYPTVEAVPNQIKINMAARLSFYIGEPIGSRVILDSNDAAEIDPTPGRAVYKLAQKTEIQCPYISDKQIGGFLHELGKNGTDIVSD